MESHPVLYTLQLCSHINNVDTNFIILFKTLWADFIFKVKDYYLLNLYHAAF